MAFFPLPLLKFQTPAGPTAMVRAIEREDVLWDRPVFKAPPLEPQLRHLNVRAYAEDLRRIGLANR
jgi:hypothetical protein